MEAIAQVHPQASRPTRKQLGMLLAGFADLGYTRADRPARMSCASAALGLDEKLTSFTELTAGQAGYLLGLLRTNQVPDAGAFYAPARIGEGVAPAAEPPAPARPGPDSHRRPESGGHQIRERAEQAGRWCAALWLLLTADAPAIVVVAAAIVSGRL